MEKKKIVGRKFHAMNNEKKEKIKKRFIFVIAKKAVVLCCRHVKAHKCSSTMMLNNIGK